MVAEVAINAPEAKTLNSGVPAVAPIAIPSVPIYIPVPVVNADLPLYKALA